MLTENHATITVHGHSYDLVDPRVIDAATAEPRLSARRRGVFHRFGIDNYVKFTLADKPSTGPNDLQDR